MLTVQFLKNLSTSVIPKQLTPRGRHRGKGGSPRYKVKWIVSHDFQLIENQFRLIETGRDSPLFFSTISIDRKIGSINRNFGKIEFLKKINQFLKKLLKALNIRNKMHEYEMKFFSKTQVLNPIFPKLRFQTFSL